MKTYPTLYAKDNLNNTRIWYCVQDGNSYYSVSGIKDGQLVTSEPTITIGKNIGKKNEVTPENQAEAEILAMYKKRKKLKYFENIEDIDKKNYFQPQLCKNYADYADELQFPVIVQLKMNGGCAVAKKNGIFSRKGEKYHTIPHIENALQPFFEKYPNAIIHGELFNPELKQKLNELMKIVRTSVNITPELLQRSEQIVRLYYFDGYLDDSGKNNSYEIRQNILNKELHNALFCEPVVSEYAHSHEAVNHIFERYIADGDEGVVVKVLNEPYEQKRSRNSLKLKPTDDAEAEIVSIDDGEGNWANKAKSILLRMPDGREFRAAFKGNMEEATEMFNNKSDYIGKQATYYYNGFTGKGKGLPNFAQLDYNNMFKS